MIAIGDTLPDITLSTPRDGHPTPIRTGEVFAGKRVLLTAVPGAFTPTCTVKHLPGYVDRIADFRARGIEVVFCAFDVAEDHAGAHAIGFDGERVGDVRPRGRVIALRARLLGELAVELRDRCCL